MEEQRQKELEGLCRQLGMVMKDLHLLDMALTHTSYAYESKKNPRPQHNQRLEFLGDSVLSLVVSTHIYKTCPQMDEGELSKLRAFLVCEETLAQLATENHLGDHLLLGKGEINLDGEENPSILADAFESVLGAYYLDQGFAKVTELLGRLLINRIPELTADGIDRDYKTRLQEVVQKDGPVEIDYEQVSAEGPSHNRTFVMRVLVNQEERGRGRGRTKKEAEQRAAREALKACK
ncbi:ribonuclease III [Acidaminococcus fermentans]|jgi:ribonuclease-3|uniref:Ribonuclease 3 n=1 Tax=Acidaminococcus fermentans TaxID=905 RepID=A0A6N7VHM0_ACIFE|nr:ribonuclease III [Acidaminococcus fermentans]MEE1597692.1 ribonuclease III [Acidaminococcus fermentans]MEE4121954.1 ribonuclease III [Acidaminococcus fermentans]MSS81107.1 ribonuclease III [Acidaminococcus fermentans]